jgi:uncharacterized membrane protein required for colicin V production
MLAEGAKQMSSTVISGTHSVGLFVGTCKIGATVGEFVGGALGETVGGFVGGAVGGTVGESVVATVGDGEGKSVDEHFVQHSQPCSTQSTLRTSISSNRQMPFGNTPVNWLFPKVRISNFSKSAIVSGIQPVNLLSPKANAAEGRKENV